jgi:hypothetical protein
MKTLAIEQMENTKAGMPCWAAKAALITAGVAFSFFTAGWGTLILGVAGLGFAEWALLESCYPKLMQ